MAVNDQRLCSSEFVQHWVNSLPPLHESDRLQSTPLSSPSTSTSGSHNSPSSSYGKSHEGSYSFPTDAIQPRRSSVPLHSVAIDPTQHPELVNGHHPLQRSATTCAADRDRRQSLHRKNSKLSWMHSNYSSFNSETSSIDILLEERKANPEQVLMNLGFGEADKSIAARLPSRFLAGQSEAHGINMQNFMKGHPELGRYMVTEANLAMGELHRRLPNYYRQVAVTESHTSLHKQFSSSSLELQSDQGSVPLTVHKGEDGTMFASILTKSNTEQLAKQGFYSEHSTPSQDSLVKRSSSSSMSTHDCTIDSVDTPSPIVLNNNPSLDSEYCKNPFISTQSSGSDSVFSSTESYSMDQMVRAKLEAIHEKSLHEISEEDLEEGISFVSRRRSDSDLVKQTEKIVEQTPDEQTSSVHRKRQHFARTKSRSFDEEGLSRMLRDKLESCNAENSKPTCTIAPVIVTTETTSQEDSSEPIIPKQADGLLQVLFNPESFDSIDSDTGTLVPSAYASPYQGLSPNNSRTGSLSLLPAMESFELEEVQSCADSNTAQSATRQRRTRLQRSVSERSDSDSSGIADIDCKSSHGQNDNGATVSTNTASSQHLELPSACDNSISSSNQTLNSISSARTAITCDTVKPTNKTRRSSDSDASDMKFYSVSSAPSSASANVNIPFSFTQFLKQERSTQTEECICPCCGTLIDSVNNGAKFSREWQINNPSYTHGVVYRSNSSVTDSCSSIGTGAVCSSAGEADSHKEHEQPKFFIVNSEGREMDDSTRSSVERESVGYSSDEPTTSVSSSDHDRRVEAICTEMSRDLRLLKDLIAKYNIDHFSRSSPSTQEDGMKQELLSSVRLVKSVLTPDTYSRHDQSTQSECSLSSLEDLSVPQPGQLTLSNSQSSPTHPQLSVSPTHPTNQPSVSPPSHSHQYPSPQHGSTFIPIALDSCHSCVDSCSKTNGTNPAPTDGRVLSSHNGCFSQCSCSAQPLMLPPPIHRRRSGSVSSTPASVQSPSTGYAHSSVSSSVSRLSDQLKLANNKCRYECV